MNKLSPEHAQAGRELRHRPRYNVETVMSGSPGDVTLLLQAMRDGQPDAEGKLLSLVYGELRRLAGYYLRLERPGHTWQSTALVHEAYLKMAGQHCALQNRGHFFGVAAQAMRRILVDHARAQQADKRGGGQMALPIEAALLVSSMKPAEWIDLDAALTRLSEFDSHLSRLVELRFFAGLTVEETAEVLGCVPRTVNRDWRTAQAWLRRELGDGDPQ
jgi:RNA polymerase sigma-70 factor (ECF subfamily)